MEERKWEDMSTDCLANIFGRLDIESRLLHIPAVCKHWYRAVQNPLCWEKLDFRAIDSESKLSQLMKIVANHSERCAISHVLVHFCTTKDLIQLSEACPALKTLELHTFLDCVPLNVVVPSFKGRWKNLEFISIDDSGDSIVELIELVCIHSTSFTGLRIGGGDIYDYAAYKIVSLLPKLKYLAINHAILEKKNLLLILQGCRELVFLDVRNCIGFQEDDEEILKLSSVIKSFRCDGSKAQDPTCNDDYNYCLDFEVQDYDDYDFDYHY
ncbi:F-box domain-containing protein [Heracleum sosnowskyi]|uniref:F-box domain-containing protein n=1 Tax=Heracleum sosnowskyi TaxID=360622 RepID=A0AAD8I365_9APIA|nr:F-box domain-containing protein [Heracleum sosnowskyi]